MTNRIARDILIHKTKRGIPRVRKGIMTMKKLLALVCALILVLSMTACSSGTPAEPTAAPTDAPTAEPTDEPAAKKLLVGTSADFAPYEYYDGDEIVGIEVEMMEKVAEKLGMEYELVDMAFDSIIAAVTSGKVDVGMSGFTVTEERKQSVDFSINYTKAKQSVIVPAKDAKITSIDDLYDKEATYAVGVQNSTTGDLYITEDVETKGLKLDIQRFTKAPDAVAALKAGKLECVIIDDQVAKAFVDENPDLVLLDAAYADEDYAMCFAKGSELTAKVDAVLQEMLDDGTIQAIIDKYIK